MVLYLCEGKMVLTYLEVFISHVLGCENKSLKQHSSGCIMQTIRKHKTPKSDCVVFFQDAEINSDLRDQNLTLLKKSFFWEDFKANVFMHIFEFYFPWHLFMAQRQQGHWLSQINRNFTFQKGQSVIYSLYNVYSDNPTERNCLNHFSPFLII